MSQMRGFAEAEAQRMLEGAAKLIGAAPICWLAAQSRDGAVNARPVGRISPHPQKTGWTISFVVDGRSRKASEIRRHSKATLIYQGDGGEAYLALNGAATICDGHAEVQRRWKADYDAFFPTDLDKANAVFIDFVAERMDLWIKGTTPEPFGLKTTTLLKDENGGWRLDQGAAHAD